MMERLFAVQAQREIFLLMLSGGCALGLLMDIARAVQARWPRAGLAADIVPALALFVLLMAVMLRTREGLRLYGLLGVALGAMLYFAGLSRLASSVARWMKNARIRPENGRKND